MTFYYLFVKRFLFDYYFYYLYIHYLCIKNEKKQFKTKNNFQAIF